MSKVHDHNSEDNDRRVLEGEKLFLLTILAAPTGIATLADATAAEFLDKPYPDGGKWRGSIPKRLAGRGIVGAVVTPAGQLAADRSPRKARRRGTGILWRLLDRVAGQHRLSAVASRLEELSPGTRHRPRSLFDDLDDPDCGPVVV